MHCIDLVLKQNGFFYLWKRYSPIFYVLPDLLLNQNVFKCLVKPPYAFSTLCIALTTFQSELTLMLIKAVICPFFSLHSFSSKMGFDAFRSSLLPFS